MEQHYVKQALLAACLIPLLAACDGSDSNDPGPKNQAPLAQPGTMLVAPGDTATGTLEGSDADGDSITFEVFDAPQHGTVQNLDPATGRFTYVAPASFEGIDRFTFRVNDGVSDSPIAAFDVRVDEWRGTVNVGTADEEDTFYALAIDDQRNLYVAYSTSGSIPGATNQGGLDVVLTKLDKTGAIVWQKQWGTTFDDEPWQMAGDANGNLYISVPPFSQGFDPAEPKYVLKYDSDGNLLWALQIPEPNTITHFYRMTVSPNGNVYINALEPPSAGNNANTLSALLKITPDGTLTWTKHLGTSTEDPQDPLLLGQFDIYDVFARGLVTDANEITYLSISLSYRPTGGSHVRSTMLAAVDGNGQIVSRVEPFTTSAFSAQTPPRIRDMRLTVSGNLRVAGDDAGFPGESIVVAEVDTAGNEIWSTARQVAGEGRFTRRAALAPDGSSVVTGTATPNRPTPGPTGEEEDIFVSKFNQNGTFVWEQLIASTRNDGTALVFDRGGEPVVDDRGSVYVVVSSFEGGIGSAPNQGGNDVLIVKLEGDTGDMIDTNSPARATR